MPQLYACVIIPFSRCDVALLGTLHRLRGNVRTTSTRSNMTFCLTFWRLTFEVFRTSSSVSRLNEILLHKLRLNVAYAGRSLHKIGLRNSPLCPERKTIDNIQNIWCHCYPCARECGTLLTPVTNRTSVILIVADVLGLGTTTEQRPEQPRYISSSHGPLIWMTSCEMCFMLCILLTHLNMSCLTCHDVTLNFTIVARVVMRMCVRRCVDSCFSLGAVVRAFLPFSPNSLPLTN